MTSPEFGFNIIKYFAYYLCVCVFVFLVEYGGNNMKAMNGGEHKKPASVQI